MQEGLVPYEINSESEYESYPNESSKRNKRVQIQKSNWYGKRNIQLRETGKQYNGRKMEWDDEMSRQPKVTNMLV